MRPFVVLVPVLDRPAHVAPLVASFEKSGAANLASLLFIASTTDASEIAALENAGARFTLTEKRSWPCKINVGYRASMEPWILCAADDVTFLPGWAEALLDELSAVSRVFTEGYRVHDPSLIFSSYDGFNPKTLSGELATHPLVSRGYADLFGTVEGRGAIAFEGYHHNYVDEEITLTARARGRLRHLTTQILEHHHWGRDPSLMDATYALGHRFLDVDRKLFESRVDRIQKNAS